MSDTPTPETDAFINRMFHDREHELTELYNFTMGLERERDAALAENTVMREAIREAHAALDGCREDTCELFAERDWWKDEPRCGYSTRWEDMKSRITKADAALARLQPFTTP